MMKIEFQIGSPKTALADALVHLGKKDLRKIGHNTYLHRTGDGAKVVFHETAILAITKKAIALNSGGYRTYTTKERLNSLLPSGYHLYAEKGSWFLSGRQGDAPGVTYTFADGITIAASGKVTGAGNEANDAKLRKQIHEYAKAYAATAMSGKLDKPSSGDCWHCSMHVSEGADKGKSLGDAVKDGDHLVGHMKERYFVPSMLVNAAKEQGNGFLQNYVFYILWGDMTDEKRAEMKAREYRMELEINRTIRKYLGRRLGLALR